MLIFKPTLVFKPKSILWASLNRKCRIVYFVKLFPLGGDTEYLEDDCNDIDESMEAKIKKKNCIKYLLFLYFYRS